MRQWINLCESIDTFDALDALAASHRFVHADMDFDGEYTLDLNSLQASPEGEGHGSAFMRDLCKLADEHDITIQLNPEGDDERLVRFYSRFGFVEISDGCMTRAPGQHAESTPPPSSPDSLDDLILALRRDGLTHIEKVPEQWLVHFTGYAEEVSREGFTHGTPITHVGWKGAWGTKENGPGFNFACAADDEQALEFWSQHVPCAVVFRAAGVTCWHKDGFDQVIFWGPSAHKPMFVIEAEYGPTSTPADDAEWSVKMENGTPIDSDSYGTGDLWTVLKNICGPLQFQ